LTTDFTLLKGTTCSDTCKVQNPISYLIKVPFSSRSTIRDLLTDLVTNDNRSAIHKTFRVSITWQTANVAALLPYHISLAQFRYYCVGEQGHNRTGPASTLQSSPNYTNKPCVQGKKFENNRRPFWS